MHRDDALPPGWMELGEDYLVELLPEVEAPEMVAIAIQLAEPDIVLVDADRPGKDVLALVRSALAVRAGLP